MKILDDAGVPVPNFGIATSSAEARKIAEDLNSKDLVIKAQVRQKSLIIFFRKRLNTNVQIIILGAGWR